MRAAGVDRFGAEIRLLELAEPAAPGPGEVLLGVRACGMGNWDEFIRTGSWTPEPGRRCRPVGFGRRGARGPGRRQAGHDYGRPSAGRAGITRSDIVVVPDGARLARLVPLLAPDAITVGASYPLAEAAAAMARLRQGTHGAAIVLEP